MSVGKQKQQSLSFRKRQSGHQSQQNDAQSGQISAKNSLSEYLNRKFMQQKHLNAYQKQIIRRQQLQNLRMIRKLSEIHHRKSPLHFTPEQDLQKKLYTLNMHSRNVQRQRRERTLQQQNDIMVERIVRMRSYNNPYPFSQTPSQMTYSISPQKRIASQSVLLPPIDSSNPST